MFPGGMLPVAAGWTLGTAPVCCSVKSQQVRLNQKEGCCCLKSEMKQIL
jgi:hypothetical protein